MFKLALLGLAVSQNLGLHLVAIEDPTEKMNEAFAVCNFNRDVLLSDGEEYICFEGQYNPPESLKEKFGQDATITDIT